MTLRGPRMQVERLSSEIKGLRGLGSAGVVKSAQRVEWTEEDKRHHGATAHAVYDERCQECVLARGLIKRAGAGNTAASTGRGTEVFCDYAIITEGGERCTLLCAAGPHGEMFARVVPRKGYHSKHLAQFLSSNAKRYCTKFGCLLVRGDNEPALSQVTRTAADAATTVTKQWDITVTAEATRSHSPWSNGRAERQVRRIKESLVIARREFQALTGKPLGVSMPIMKWLVRHLEWCQNFLKPVEVPIGEGIGFMSCYEAATGRRGEWQLWQFVERVISKRNTKGSQENERHVVCWFVGLMPSGDSIVLHQDGKVEGTPVVRRVRRPWRVSERRSRKSWLRPSEQWPVFQPRHPVVLFAKDAQVLTL